MKNKKTIPSKKIFMVRENEAKYWEKNLKEAWNDGKTAKVNFSKNLSETINIRLDPPTLKIVRETAERKGIGPTQLIRMWIKERLSQIADLSTT